MKQMRRGLAAIPLLITLAAIAGILAGTSLVQKSTQESFPKAQEIGVATVNCTNPEGCGGGCLNNHNYGCGYAGCRWWEACGGGRELGGCYATGDGSTQYDYLQAPDGACNARSTAGHSENTPIADVSTPTVTPTPVVGGNPSPTPTSGGNPPTATPTPGSDGNDGGECTPIDSVTLNKANPNAGESFTCRVTVSSGAGSGEFSCGIVPKGSWDSANDWPENNCPSDTNFGGWNGNTATFNCVMPDEVYASTHPNITAMHPGEAFTMVGRDFISTTRCEGKTASGTVGGGTFGGIDPTATPTPNATLSRKSVKWTNGDGGICSTTWSANSCNLGATSWNPNSRCSISNNSVAISGDSGKVFCQYYECNECSNECSGVPVRQIGSDITLAANCTYTCSESGITSSGTGCTNPTPSPTPTNIPDATHTPSPTPTSTEAVEQSIRVAILFPDSVVGKSVMFGIKICPSNDFDNCINGQGGMISVEISFEAESTAMNINLIPDSNIRLVNGTKYTAVIGIVIGEGDPITSTREFTMTGSSDVGLTIDLRRDGVFDTSIGALENLLDIDGSGNITTLDFGRVIRQYGKTWEMAGSILSEDVNLDGRVNAVDISLVIHNIGNSVGAVSIPTSN